MTPLSPEAIASLVTRIARGRRIRRTLPEHGRLHVDRSLPFLCVFRLPATPGGDRSGRVLVRGEGAYLIAPDTPEQREPVGELVRALARAQADTFGAFLLLELWVGAPGSPAFRIRTPWDPEGQGEPSTVTALAQALAALPLPAGARTTPEIVVENTADCAPPGQTPFLTPEQARAQGCLTIGLEVPPVYRTAGGTLLPMVLRAFHGELSHALQKTFFEFARVQTNAPPPHYLSLGRRAFVRAVWEADRELAALDGMLHFLLNVTPVNAEEAWRSFQESRFARAPVFHYHLLTLDPDRLKQRLHAIRLQGVEDPTLARLFREKRRELDRQITLLEDRDTPAFLGGSLALFGGVSEELYHEARRILARPLAASPDGEDGGAWLDADAFAALARAEIAYYRERWPALTAEVQVRPDVPGVMVAEGNLLIGAGARVAAVRARGLLHHEVGTHILTHANGAAQPLRLLACGLPGYEEFQEGIAVFAEYLTGGLTPARLRLLAGRVMAVRALLQGDSFGEVFAQLRESYGFAARTAFTVTMRVFRSGGMTKDAVYLRGVLAVLRYLREHGATDLLWIGKIAAEHLPLMEELRWREVLRPAPLRPRYLDDDAVAAQRLHTACSPERTLLDLVA